MLLLVVLLLLWCALLVGYVVVRSWHTVTVGARLRGIVVAFALLAWANFIVADSLPSDLYGGRVEFGYVRNGHYFLRDRYRVVEVPANFFRGAYLYRRVSIDALAVGAFGMGLVILWILRQRKRTHPPVRTEAVGIAAAVRTKAIIFLIASSVSSVAAVIVGWLGLVSLVRQGNVAPLFSISGVLVLLAVTWHLISRRTWLRYDMERRDRSRCRQCGYSLTGNTSGMCPECGTPIPAAS